VGGTVCGDDNAGVEVLAGIEVLDGGRAGEAEALGFAGGFGVGREWGDARGSTKEGGAEGFDSITNWGDAAEAGDYDTIHFFSLLMLRLL
jgi:hypothetical protein